MSTFRAAAGGVDLQPVVGSRMAGFAARLEPATGCHDPLMAKLLFLDDGRARLLWVACDLIGFSPGHDLRLRELLATTLAIPTSNVLLSCTHTHSGPCSMPFRGPLGQVDEAWLARMTGRIVATAASLAPRLRPARLAHACEIVTGLGYNRHDGTSPIDERLWVAQVTDAHDQTVIATLLNYATHPVVLGARNRMFSADYPGCATSLVERSMGGVALFILGSAGDVDPIVYLERGRDAGSFETAQEMGQELATAVVRATMRAQPYSGVTIAIDERCVELPLESPPAKDELFALKSQFKARRGSFDSIPMSSDGRWAMFELEWALELEEAMSRSAVPSALPVPLFAVRVGNLYAVTFPLEIYSQIGLDVREQLAPHPLVIAAYTNGLFGYAPTDRAIEQGGYGPATSHRFFPHLLTPLARGSDSLLVRAATELVRALPRHQVTR